MQLSILSILSTLAATAIAVPVAVPGENHHSTATVMFFGAADASFTQDFKTDGTETDIHNVLSISKISVPAGVTCTFDGIDGSVTKVSNQAVVDVGPPQTQVSGACWNL
ncbi:hypothetical protein SI65_07266 [Aspergillus cristatus]|uniref:Uncharacterized protein n=1 Tax=Aspergillus cristatus TaxID=573508 RepID=A0A1E3B9W4_ASPCR|nr:hypothetical protein SI65_07266 [Aspergillus cristatus]